MQRFIQRRFFAILTVASLAIALPAIAQRVRQPTLKGNPYRNMGGSCVYGTRGEVLFAPAGVVCGSKEEPVTKAAETMPADRFGGLSAELRAEMQSLRKGHVHMAKELTELRRAVAQGRKVDALRASDHLVEELTAQLVREERLFEALSAPPASRAQH